MSAPPTNIPVAIPAGTPAGAPVSGFGAPPPPTIAGSIPGARAIAGRLLAGTPGRMRLFGLLGVIAALVIGGLSANALLGSRAAAERAANNTAQVIRVQSIQVALLRADALATNAFLVGGLESPDTRAKYDEAMGIVAKGLAQAAAAQPADGNALGALSEDVQTYVSLVEQARSNNRLGLPIGAQYLTQASDGLRADAIPVVTAIVSANESRATEEFGRADSSLQLVGGALAVLVLILIAVWLARRTHRYINASLTAGIAILAIGLFIAASTISAIGNTTAQVSDGAYRQAVDLAHIRTAANDARANESLTLIKRGSGAKYEAAWVSNDKLVDTTLTKIDSSAGLTRQWDEYGVAHVAVRALDNGNKWDQAVSAATVATEAPSMTFDAFDKAVTESRDDASTSAINQLTGLGSNAPLYAAAIALAALIASWLIVRGIGQRIQEYR